MSAEYERHENLLRSWREKKSLCEIFRKERERAIGLQICESMLVWLDGSGEAPARSTLLAALKCRPDQIVAFGAVAMRDVAVLDKTQWPMLFGLFGVVSIRAAEEIMTTFGPPVAPALLAELAGAAIEHHAPQVRRTSIERAYWWDLEEFPSLVAQMRRGELDSFVLENVDIYESLSLRGYSARFDKASWSWQVKYRTGGSIAYADIPKMVVGSLGLDTAVQHVREHMDAGDRFVPWDKFVDGA